MTKREIIAHVIRSRQREIDLIEGEIADLCKKCIPDYHFMRYSVSTFWGCDQSPVGMCVFMLDDETGHRTTCRYCGGPTERK